MTINLGLSLCYHNYPLLEILHPNLFKVTIRTISEHTGTILLIVNVDRFDLLKKSGSTYITVIEDENKEIIASATLLIEHKFLHECGSVGHIEDVVVHDSQRGKRLGIR